MAGPSGDAGGEWSLPVNIARPGPNTTLKTNRGQFDNESYSTEGIF